MSDNATIKDAVRELSKNDESIYSVVCTVASVSGKKCDCSPVNGDADILEVRLMADEQTGILVTPTVNSKVIVTMINKVSGYVSMFSSIDSIELNGSNFNGLVKVAELTAKINALESDLNTLKTAFSSWVVAPTDGGAALKAITAAWYTSPITATTQTEIENIKIKHGG